MLYETHLQSLLSFGLLLKSAHPKSLPRSNLVEETEAHVVILGF